MSKDKKILEDCELCGEPVPENSHPPELCDGCAWDAFNDGDFDDE